MMINLQNGPALTLNLGRQGENGVKTFEFDFSALADEFGLGTLSLIAQRSTDTEPYPVALDIDGTTALWTVSNVDTDVLGVGKAQFIYTADEKTKKTIVYSTVVEKSLRPATDEPPDKYDNWLEELAVIGSQVSADKAIALTEISIAKADALQSVSAAKSNALQDVSTTQAAAVSAVADRQETALQAINARGGEIIGQAQDAAGNAAVSATAASGYATDAGQSAQAAEQYADEARSYAENLHFADDGEGNVIISIGG